MLNFVSVGGLFLMLLTAYLISTDRKAIDFRLVV